MTAVGFVIIGEKHNLNGPLWLAQNKKAILMIFYFCIVNMKIMLVCILDNKIKKELFL